MITIITPFLDRHNDSLELYYINEILSDDGYILDDISQLTDKEYDLTELLNKYNLSTDEDNLYCKTNIVNLIYDSYKMFKFMEDSCKLILKL